jgi:hypothetical protein
MLPRLRRSRPGLDARSEGGQRVDEELSGAKPGRPLASSAVASRRKHRCVGWKASDSISIPWIGRPRAICWHSPTKTTGRPAGYGGAPPPARRLDRVHNTMLDAICCGLLLYVSSNWIQRQGLGPGIIAGSGTTDKTLGQFRKGSGSATKNSRRRPSNHAHADAVRPNIGPPSMRMTGNELC